MEKQPIRLTTAEISALWTTYIESSAMRCFYLHFIAHIQDQEIRPIIEEAEEFTNMIMNEMENIFREEEFPIPIGFTNKDIDLTAPALYSDLFALSFVYRGGQMIIKYYATILSKVARQDVYELIEKCLIQKTSTYKKSLNLMLSKGIYDRPPHINPQKQAELMKSEPTLMNIWFGDSRPLNALEISELFFSIERNCIGLVLIIGLLQVSNDKEVKKYLIKGKKLCQKQIEVFNGFIKENDQFPTYPVTLEVTDSSTSPFSEKLILFIITSSNQIGLKSLSDALSVSMRHDLALKYTLFIGDIMKFGGEGLKLMIQRGWMEQPPESIDRKKLYE
ncbi:hypothetical protein JOC86_000222 [Bacillus pakistanensis]|uniref:Sugar isomerase n=1 Tax=Rossellomorea pakistanensis TaxID=992288 RepID=A0ABS2N749_9BACI|nr:hypothetical protein [Bacillus pakistanensis]